MFSAELFERRACRAFRATVFGAFVRVPLLPRPSRRTPLPVRQLPRPPSAPMRPQGAGSPTRARRGLQGSRRARKWPRGRRVHRPNRPAGASRRDQGAAKFRGAQDRPATGAPAPQEACRGRSSTLCTLGGAAVGTLNAAANTPIAFPPFVAQPAAATQNAGVHALVTPGTYTVTAVPQPTAQLGARDGRGFCAPTERPFPNRRRASPTAITPLYTLQTLVSHRPAQRPNQPDLFRRAGADRS